MAGNGCVIFAKNIEVMTAFYKAVLKMHVSEAISSHTVLSNAATELVIHAIPKKIAESIVIENPPKIRAASAIKPAFIVESLEEVRLACTNNGGGLKPSNDMWEIRGAKVLDGWDPEGNVIQFKQLMD